MSHYYYLAPEVLLPFSPLTSEEFDLIRRKAREQWQDETKWSAASVTTYSGSYREKQLDEATCKQLAQRLGQKQLECKQILLPNSFGDSTLSSQAAPLKAADGKGGHPGRAKPSCNIAPSVKHRVAHQVWGSPDPAPIPLDYKASRISPSVKLQKPDYDLLLSYKARGKNLLKQFQQQWDNESRFGSSENSETDGYYPDYSIHSLESFK